MLKLTQPNGVTVYVSPAHISAIIPYSTNSTEIRFAGGVCTVRESPEEVMAMDAMIYFMNPAVVLKA